MRQRHFIDSHKAATAPAVLAMMALHGAWGDSTAWLYLAMHGTYGFLWISKSRLFPDRSWERPCSPAYGVVIWAGLSLYWLAPWLITSSHVHLPPWYAAGCVAMYGAGIFLHFSADMQKHTSLRLRPRSLITEGLWARCRNPNYLGELLIYLAFALLARHWLPLAVLGLFVLAVWVPNMLRKDRSLARYPGFAIYRKRSWRLVPWIW